MIIIIYFILLFQCLEAIERTNLKFFQSEMTAEFYALKGMLLGQIGDFLF